MNGKPMDVGIHDVAELRALAARSPHWFLGDPMATILDRHAVTWMPGTNTYRGRRMRIKDCYRNCGTRASRHLTMTYCEGYIQFLGIPISHAWLLNRKGEVIDPTLRRTEDDPPTPYVGVAFRTEYLIRTVLDKDVWGLLHYDNREILDLDPNTYLAPHIHGHPGSDRTKERNDQ